MADPIRLKTVTRTQGNNQALKDGTVKPHLCELEFIEVDPLIDAFRRMVRTLEFDVSEMAMTTYITAREHGKKMMGLPIFLMRAFHHGAIHYNVKSGIKSPKDLEGRKVAFLARHGRGHRSGACSADGACPPSRPAIQTGRTPGP